MSGLQVATMTRMCEEVSIPELVSLVSLSGIEYSIQISH